ncbi:ParB-related ThiF-related cassette protein E domain-containing protein (plasmid) [Pararobbsia alpina]|uniref:PRTRC system protein E n=1 Tax=Pararobbsia alpina TaxID=621374 RepID=UPI0039A604DF
MFQLLEGIVASCDKVVLTMKAVKGAENPLMSVVVVPFSENASDPALKQPFQLTGTAADLDEHFAKLLAGYAVQRATLAEQAAAAALVLEAATKSQSRKATTAIAKGSKPALETAEVESDGEDEAGESSPAVSTPDTPPVATASSGTNMADLLG